MTSELSRERAEKLGKAWGWLCGIAVALLMILRPWGSVRTTSFDASALAFGRVPIEVQSQVEFFAVRTRVGFMLAEDHPLRASARSGENIDAWLLPICEQVEAKTPFGSEENGGLPRAHLRAAILDGARTRNALGGEFAETNWRGMWIVSFWIAGLIALRWVVDKVLCRWPSLIACRSFGGGRDQVDFKAEGTCPAKLSKSGDSEMTAFAELVLPSSRS